MREWSSKKNGWATLHVLVSFWRTLPQRFSTLGRRPDECHRLPWENIAWINGRTGTSLVTEGKTAAARRSVPLTPRLRSILEGHWIAAGNRRKDGYGRLQQRAVDWFSVVNWPPFAPRCSYYAAGTICPGRKDIRPGARRVARHGIWQPLPSLLSSPDTLQEKFLHDFIHSTRKFPCIGTQL